MERDIVDIDPSVVRSAVVVDRPNSPIPADGERDGGPETVELVLRLSREVRPRSTTTFQSDVYLTLDCPNRRLCVSWKNLARAKIN